MRNQGKLIRFAIRTLTVGVCSAMVGLLVGMVGSSSVEATEETARVQLTYQYVAEDELAETEKQVLRSDLPQVADHSVTYYLVYRLDKQVSLPKTASHARLLPLIGGACLLVIAVRQLKKQRTVVSLLLFTSLGGVSFISQVDALHVSLFAQYSQTFLLNKGDALPDGRIQIDGYSFIGYLEKSGEEELVADELTASSEVSPMDKSVSEKHFASTDSSPLLTEVSRIAVAQAVSPQVNVSSVPSSAESLETPATTNPASEPTDTTDISTTKESESVEIISTTPSSDSSSSSVESLETPVATNPNSEATDTAEAPNPTDTGTVAITPVTPADSDLSAPNSSSDTSSDDSLETPVTTNPNSEAADTTEVPNPMGTGTAATAPVTPADTGSAHPNSSSATSSDDSLETPVATNPNSEAAGTTEVPNPTDTGTVAITPVTPADSDLSAPNSSSDTSNVESLETPVATNPASDATDTAEVPNSMGTGTATTTPETPADSDLSDPNSSSDTSNVESIENSVAPQPGSDASDLPNVTEPEDTPNPPTAPILSEENFSEKPDSLSEVDSTENDQDSVRHMLEQGTNKNISQYRDEEGELRSILWAKGIRPPQMGNEGDFKKTITPAGHKTYIEYKAPFVANQGWYDINKSTQDTADKNLCFAVTATNMLHWWMDQNKEELERYIEKQGNPTRTVGGRTYQLTDFIQSPQDQENSAVYQLLKSFYAGGGGYYTDLVLDFFINGYPPHRGKKLEDDQLLPHASAGLFYDVFSYHSLSERTAPADYTDFSQRLIELLGQEQLIGMVYPILGGSHIVTLWGAEYDSNGKLAAVYVTDSDDQFSPQGAMIRYQVKNANGRPKISTEVTDPNIGAEVLYLNTLDLGKKQWEQYFSRNN
ncbi:IdeS/Mac family cysteine endopeptidase [Streptococcus sp. zg-86]|uniref:IdeS/Mac family cysteine endopeptidase n=1 Tax=Streptococcus TaxID=1301 RepID=UPI0015E63088|nr:MULTISPECIES: IdeS/Mac family cysteine endopeptidase [unclassified Streptococcus]QTH48228.1 IdeS/Mac family cysteine endopeptidase [Streptococcus sp. zg-86]